MSSDVILVIVVGTALAFDFTNGFHDTANVVATSISTGAARPQVAIAFASLLNFVGAFISISVAATVANDVVDAAVVTPTVVFAGPDRGDLLEPDHLVLRPALELLARVDRRRGRLRRRLRRPRRDLRRRPGRQSPGARGDRADPRLRRRRHRDRLRLQDRRQAEAGDRDARLPLRADRLRRAARPRPRHQRRPEDDGDHHPGPDRERHPRGRLRPADLGDRLLGDWRSRWAPTAAAGGSSKPPARGSSRWTPPRGSPRRARGRR